VLGGDEHFCSLKRVQENEEVWGFFWWNTQFFLAGKQTPSELAEPCTDEPVFHHLMQKLWHLRPQVASRVHLVRCAMSEGLIGISLKLRPLVYKHQTVLPTNRLIMLPRAMNVGDRVPGLDGTLDAC